MGMRLPLTSKSRFASELLAKMGEESAQPLVKESYCRSKTEAGIGGSKERIGTLKKKLAGHHSKAGTDQCAVSLRCRKALDRRRRWMAYDIGSADWTMFGFGRNVNILVLDTEVIRIPAVRCPKAHRGVPWQFAAGGNPLRKKIWR